MQEQADTRKFWVVNHPLDQYVEDVKQVARMHHLRLMTDNPDHLKRISKEWIEENPPKLTRKDGLKANPFEE